MLELRNISYHVETDGTDKEIIKNTIFLFDLCANSSIVKKINNENILFFTNGHPLCNYIEENSKEKFKKLLVKLHLKSNNS